MATRTNRQAHTALSDQHKEAVKSWVPKVRQVLEKDLAAQLTRLGIGKTGEHTPPESMSLSPEAQATRRRVDALLQRDSAAEGGAKQGYDNVLRELTYTALNRLVGLKAMEARNVLYLPPPTPDGVGGGAPEQTEAITPVSGQARSRYLRDFRAAGGSRYKYEDDAEEALLRNGLEAAYRHINEEIRLLFDPDHEYACVWPTHACLVEVIRTINKDIPDEAYAAVDFLGWIYQFFNRDEKKRVRDENKGTPRSSYELSVINQFFTPSWVVKALVDNTLGRLWLQMHPDSALRATEPTPLPGQRKDPRPVADYLVPRTGERIRYQRFGETGQVEPFKLARDITLLDPACGTMHFGQYAFGLFQQMYLDEIEHAGQEGWPVEPSVQNASEIPAAILENNLFGVDIDPRAIQIASLSLMLTAKEAALGLGLSPVDMKVKRANLVVANAVDVGRDRLNNLIGRLGTKLGSPELQDRLFVTLWENLQHVGELGSLIQVREGVSAVLDDWVEAQAKAKGLGKIIRRKETRQLQLGRILDDADREKARQLVLQRAVLEEEAEAIQRELLAAIEDAAGELASDPAERLFAEDTARGLRLLNVLSRRFDVVLMNPPYGSPTRNTRKPIDAMYPLGRNDIYCAFVERGLQLTEDHGYLGALTSRTFFSGPRNIDFRVAMLGAPWSLVWMGDLGSGILDDATVSTACYVVSPKGSAPETYTTVFDLDCEEVGRETRFVTCMVQPDGEHSYQRMFRFFLGIADHRLAYRLFGSLTAALDQYPPLFPEYLESSSCVGRKHFAPSHVAVVQGMIPVPLDRFVRYAWEPGSSPRKRWIPLAKGGDYGRFYHPENLVVDWTDDGEELKKEARRRYGSASRTIKNTKYFGKPGITFPRVSSIGFSCRRMPEEAAFTDKGQLIMAAPNVCVDSLMALLNSRLIVASLHLLNPGRFTEVNDLALLPVPRDLDVRLGAICRDIEIEKASWSQRLEPSEPFAGPHLLGPSGAVVDRLGAAAQDERGATARIRERFDDLNQIISTAYALSAEDARRVESVCRHLPPESVWPQMEKKTTEQKRMEHVWRLLSYVVKRVVEADDDGIVPFMAAGGETALIDRVRAELAALLPDQDINQVEVDITNELKRKVKGYRRVQSVREWLEDIFFDYHVSLYKKRPILWHIASSQGRGAFAFGALTHYHKFDHDRLAKLRGSYLRDAIARFRREAGLADQEGRTEDRQEWQDKLEEAQALDQRLQWVQEGVNGHPAPGDCRICTPWKSDDELPDGWRPDLDDGVAVNILPLQTAGVLRVPKVV